MLIAPKHFRDEEYLKPKEILKRAGIDVVTASKTKGVCTGMMGAQVVSDITINEINVDDYNALILIGGGGASLYFHDELVHQKVNDFNDAGKLIAAICLAPVILANAGIMKGRRMTGWTPDSKVAAKKTGAVFTEESISLDGNVITAIGPSAAKEFGEMIVKYIR